VSSLDKGLRILNELAEARGVLGVSDLARRLNTSKSSVHNVLRVLEAHGLASQDPLTKRFSLGTRLLRFAAVLLDQMELPRLADGVMRQLMERTGETSILTIRDGEHSVCVHKVESLHSVRMTAQIGLHSPLYAGGSNKVLLAYIPEAERARLLDRIDLCPYTDRTITDRALLEAELATIRRLGFAYSDSEVEEGIAAVGAPVFDFTGLAAAAISVAGPSTRVWSRRDHLVTAVKEAARALSEKLGGSRPVADSAAVRASSCVSHNSKGGGA